MRCVLFGTAVALMLVGCASPPSQPSGCIAYSPAVPFVASLGRVCATQLDNRWAVSVKHAGYALVETDVIKDPDYDIVFFRHDGIAPPWADAQVGDKVTAEGNPGMVLDYLVSFPVPNRETVSGKVISVAKYCGTKETPSKCTNALVHNAPIEHGYSGGPLIGESGRIVGMNVAGKTDQTLGVALPTALIWAEFARLVPAGRGVPSPDNSWQILDTAGAGRPPSSPTPSPPPSPAPSTTRCPHENCGSGGS